MGAPGGKKDGVYKFKVIMVGSEPTTDVQKINGKLICPLCGEEVGEGVSVCPKCKVKLRGNSLQYN